MKNISRLVFALLLCTSFHVAGAQKNNFPTGVFGTWGHGNMISNEIIRGMPFIRGWNFTFPWKEIEPQKGKFNWKLFDDQLNTAADNDLYIGFMIWVGQNSPEWVYDVDGVPKVVTNDDKHDWPYFPYYFSEAYKTDYRHLLKSVFDHLKTMPEKTRRRMLFWMSAEGTTGDESPYKGNPVEAKYNIPDEQWTAFKQEVWSYMYKEGKSLTPQLNILINQANNGQYFNWLLANTPTVWFKAGSLAHTYSFTRELDYYNRLKRLMRPDNNGMTNRFRSESEEVQDLGWYAQSPQQNSFCIAVSSLHTGLDIMNVRRNAVREAEGDYSFQFFNRYAGQRDPATATGAFCVLRDVLDATDTQRFPESAYGPVIAAKGNPAMMKNEAGQMVPRQLKDVNPDRVQKILDAFTSQGAHNGPSPEVEKKIYADDAGRLPKLRKNALRPDLQDKYNNDMGVNLIPGNYYRFLEQYSPNTTSKGHWRVGPANQPYGRYARGFDHTSGMNEMWFALAKDFYTDNNTAHKAKIAIAYLDKGNGQWSLNYNNGKGKTEAYKVQCKNSGKWVIKEVMLSDLNSAKKLEHDTDISLKYVSGDDTVFSLIELTRL